MKCHLSCSDESFNLIVAFCILLWQNNVTASQNVEVPDAKGSHPLAWLPIFLKLFGFWQISLQFGSLRQFFTSVMSQLPQKQYML